MSKSEQELVARLTSQAELVGSLTHELKGLLTGIEGGVYMFESGMKRGKPERFEQGRDLMRRNLARMRRVLVPWQ